MNLFLTLLFPVRSLASVWLVTINHKFKPSSHGSFSHEHALYLNPEENCRNFRHNLWECDTRFLLYIMHKYNYCTYHTHLRLCEYLELLIPISLIRYDIPLFICFYYYQQNRIRLFNVLACLFIRLGRSIACSLFYSMYFVDQWARYLWIIHVQKDAQQAHLGRTPILVLVFFFYF